MIERFELSPGGRFRLGDEPSIQPKKALPAEAAREFANRWPDPSFNVDLAKAVGAGGLPDELDMAFQIPLAIAGKQGARADQLDAEARLALARAEASY